MPTNKHKQDYLELGVELTKLKFERDLTKLNRNTNQEAFTQADAVYRMAKQIRSMMRLSVLSNGELELLEQRRNNFETKMKAQKYHTQSKYKIRQKTKNELSQIKLHQAQQLVVNKEQAKLNSEMVKHQVKQAKWDSTATKTNSLSKIIVMSDGSKWDRETGLELFD